MFVVIAGGGRTGAQLARSLLGDNHEVHVIEHRKEVLARIHRELPTEVIYPGNALDTQVLEQAGIKEAQVFAAVTTSDAENLSLCFLVKERYRINRTIARVNNPRDAWLFDKKFNVDVALNQADILSSLIEEEMSMGDMITLLKLKKGRYSLVEEKIPPKSCGDRIFDYGIGPARGLCHRGDHPQRRNRFTPWGDDFRGRGRSVCDHRFSRRERAGKNFRHLQVI
jgi:trk system potassium uptake protein TrkA